MPALAWLMNMNFAGGEGPAIGTVSQRFTVHGARETAVELEGTRSTRLTVYGPDDSMDLTSE